jgi:hypothetical protein
MDMTRSQAEQEAGYRMIAGINVQQEEECETCGNPISDCTCEEEEEDEELEEDDDDTEEDSDETEAETQA